MKLLRRQGQSTGEYAILFAVVLGAVVMMQNYIRNGIAKGIQLQADNYRTAAGGSAVAVNSTADQVSKSEDLMTAVDTGKATTNGTSTSYSTGE